MNIQPPVGIAGQDLKSATRQADDSEAPAWDINDKLQVVGKKTPRIDGKLKVTGSAKYTADINLPGLLYARMIVATIPSGRVRFIQIEDAEKVPGYKAIRWLGKGIGERIRFAGQPIGAVAATSEQAAEDCVRAIKITYDESPFVVDIDKAKEPDAPLVFEEGKAKVAKGTAGGGGAEGDAEQQGNIRGPNSHGDKAALDEALKTADVIVEDEFRTQVQTHSALETHGVVADWKPNLLTVWASTQGTNSVRDELANHFKLPKSQVRVITEFMGGGFGAKFGAGDFGILAANLSEQAGAPVKLMLPRKQEHLSAGNRPSVVAKLKIGAKKDGSLVGMHLVSYGTGGIGGGAGCSRPIRDMYPCPHIVTEESDVFINAGPAAAMRAPGSPQGVYVLEQMIDELAEKLGMDPLELREKIDVHNERSESHRLERQIGAQRIGWNNRKPPGSDPGPIKRGLGCAQSIWFRGAQNGVACEVKITHDGSVEILSSVQDIGGGIRTALAQVVAEELGLQPTDITVKIGDTTFPPGPASGGSMTTNSITPAARNAAYLCKKKFDEALGDQAKGLPLKKAARLLKVEEISARAERREEYKDGAGKGVGGGSVGGVQFAQVAVDTETGKITVERVVAVHDCGRPINPLALESQINGGIIQGISYALLEDRILDRQTGVMVNANLEQYKILGAKDIPQIEPILIEQYWGRSSTDAGPIGEPAIVPTAGCIANAVYNAIGVRVKKLPMTPRVVLEALATRSM